MTAAPRLAVPEAPAPALTGGRMEWWLAVALALLSCLPVLAVRYPQMSDYPAHLAGYYVMLDGGHDPVLARYYDWRWQWGGNVGVELIIRPFAALFGLETGAKIIVALIPPLTGLGLCAVAGALRRRPGIGVMLAFAFIWSPMLLIGLLNFALGQALALWAFALWITLAAPRQRGLRAALFVPIGLGVWLCHISAWGILGVLVAGYEGSLAAGWWPRVRALIRPWPLLAPLLVMALHHAGGIMMAGGTSYGGAYWWVFKRAIWLKAMRDAAFPLDFLGEAAVLAAIAAAMMRRAIDPRLGWAALALALLSIALPRHIAGGDYADYRMVTAGLMIGCLAIDWQPAGARGRLIVLFGAPALYLARLAATTLSWQADSAETERLLGALDHIPQGARVASVVLVPTDQWPLDRLEHIGAYAVLRRQALVNANFAIPGVHMLHLKVPYYTDPSQCLFGPPDRPVDLARFPPAAGADYLWYVGAPPPNRLPAGARIIYVAPGTFVARLAPLAKPRGER